MDLNKKMEGLAWPAVALLLLTYRRTGVAMQTMNSVVRNLLYSGPLAWYIADDGSPAEHIAHLLEARELMKDREGRAVDLLGYHSERRGAGANWNAGWRAVHEDHGIDFVLWLEDDWELRAVLELDPYVKLLQEVEGVGFVRLGYMAVGSDLRSVGHAGRHYMEYVRAADRSQYAYSGNPSLRHRRFWEAFGPYPEGKDPGETEVAYDWRVRSKITGPEIWWPVDLGGWSVWGHTGQERSY